MNLEDLIKLAGVTKSPYDTPVQEQLPSESEGMRTLIALVTPEQLNQLKGEEAVAEELPGEATTEPNPQPYEGPLGSPADLSLRRYLGANGVPVNVDETKVYEDHKVEDITEAWKTYKVEEGELPPGLKEYQKKKKKKKKDDIDEHHQKDAEGNTIPHDDEVSEQKVAEETNEESIKRLQFLSGLKESYVMERPSDRSRRGTRPPDAIGPSIIQPKVGEPIPEPRQPKPKKPAIIGPGAGDPVMPGISSADLDGDMPDEPSKPMPGIDPKDLDGDMPAVPDTPDMGKDFFGRDKAALAKKDAMFKKYGLTPPASALFQSADPLEEEPNEANKFIKAKIDAEKDGEDSFTVDGKKYKVKDSADLDRLRQLAGAQQVDEGGMKQAEIEVQDWVEKYDDYMGVNGDMLPEGYLQAMLNTGIMSDAFDQDEYIAFNKKNGYEDDGDWDEDDHVKFMQSSPITKGMFDEIREIQDKYGIDEQGVNDIMGYFESVNRLKNLAGV